MQTTDGEDLCFCKAHYVVTDDDAVRERLAHTAELEADDDGYAWLNRAGNAVMGPGPVTLALPSQIRV